MNCKWLFWSELATWVFLRVMILALRVKPIRPFICMVGAARFELTTYGTQNRRATRLRHAPNNSFYYLNKRIGSFFSEHRRKI